MLRIARRSVRTIWSMSGYCTFTATCSPLCKRATCTWPMDAEAMGTAVELGEHLVGSTPAELLAQPRLDVLVGPGRHLVLQPLQLAPERLGQEVGHDADQLADLDEQALQLDHRLFNAAGIPTVGLLGQGFQAIGPAEATLQRQPHIGTGDQHRGGVRLQQAAPGGAVDCEPPAADTAGTGAGGGRRAQHGPVVTPGRRVFALNRARRHGGRRRYRGPGPPAPEAACPPGVSVEGCFRAPPASL